MPWSGVSHVVDFVELGSLIDCSTFPEIEKWGLSSLPSTGGCWAQEEVACGGGGLSSLLPGSLNLPQLVGLSRVVLHVSFRFGTFLCVAFSTSSRYLDCEDLRVISVVDRRCRWLSGGAFHFWIFWKIFFYFSTNPLLSRFHLRTFIVL